MRASVEDHRRSLNANDAEHLQTEFVSSAVSFVATTIWPILVQDLPLMTGTCSAGTSKRDRERP